MTSDPILDAARARWWLTNLGRPERLGDAHMAALLRAHGRGAVGSSLDVGRAGAQLLTETIEGLAPSGLPYRVLKTCFLDGVKSRQAAVRLGLSERQLSRERSRAVALLVAELTPRLRRVACGTPPPLPEPFLARPHVARSLEHALAHRRVRVTGAPGSGKTALVAAHAAGTNARTFWYGGDAGLPAVLFELGDHLVGDDPSLAGYVRGALPDLDEGLATRVALAALARRERLLVFDGVAGDAALDAFLAEAVGRLPLLTVVEIRSPAGVAGASVTVPPFEPDETKALLRMTGASPGDDVVAGLHSWTGGNPRLVAAVAAWIAGGSGARGPLEHALRQRSASGTTLRGMTGAARRPAPVALSA